MKRAKFTIPPPPEGAPVIPGPLSASGEKEVGYVISTQDYIVIIEGLPSARLYNIVVTKTGGRAIISALEKDRVEGLMLDSERPKPGDYFELSDYGLRLPLSVDLFGRVINPLGMALDGKAGLPPGGEALDLDTVAPGIDGRASVTEQFYTGLTIVDTLLPIGKGQRELIMCEPRSGKEQFFLDVIQAQKTQDRICIYAAVGRSELEVKRFSEDVKAAGADTYTIIVAATSSESAPMIQICPSVASSLAEYYRNNGKHVLLILDDMATHAKYAREISLLAGRIPGRESYPADIFYQHSSIMERAGNYNEHYGGGSITLLPVVETNIENFTNLIPTNVMSMTDGHILFSASLRAQGIYPAIEPDRSVTRVGRQTQKFIHKILSDRVRSMLADYHELERYGRFGSELSAETQLKIKRGKVIEELLKQEPAFSIPPDVQMIMLALVFTGFFDAHDLEFVRSQKNSIITILGGSSYTSLREAIKTVKLDELIGQFKEQLKPLEDACQPSQT